MARGSLLAVNDRKELLSDAYLGALAAVAGLYVIKPSPDRDSTDWIVRDRYSVSVNLQLKCTADLESSEGATIPFDLSLKNYNDLRAKRAVPAYLAVLHVPRQPERWITHRQDLVEVRHRAYWMEMNGLPTRPNRRKVTVHIPVANELSATVLLRWISASRKHRWP